MSSKSITRSVNLYLNDRGVEPTIKNIAAEYKILKNQIAKLPKDAQEYNDKIRDLQRLRRVLDDHNAKVRGTSKAWIQSKLSMGNFVGFLAAGATAQTLIQAGGRLFDIAANMELGGQKAETVFGPALAYVTDEAKKNAQQLGLTNAQYVAMATNIGDLLIPMGFTRQEAAGISSDLVNLSGALSEWTGGTIAATDVSRILSKAMLGEREELKQLGIAINENDVKNRLAAKGLEDLTGKMLEQAKAAATLELITEKSTDAQTSFAESTGGLVRQKAEVVAQIRSLSEDLSLKLLPVFSRLLSVAGRVISIFDENVDVLKEQNEAVRESQFEFNSQIAILKNANLSQEERNKLISDINSKYGTYLGNLISEKDTIKDIEVAQKRANEAFTQRILLNSFEDEIQKAANEAKEYIALAAEAEKTAARLKDGVLTPLEEALLDAPTRDLTNFGEDLLNGIKENGGDPFLELAKEAEEGKLAIEKTYDDLAKKLGTTLGDIQSLFGGSADSDDGSSPLVPSNENLEKAEEKLVSHLERIKTFIEQAENERLFLTDEEESLARVSAKYDKEIELLKQEEGDVTEVMADLLRLRAQALEEVRRQFEEERESDELARIDEIENKKTETKLAAEYRRLEIQREINRLLLSDKDQELAAVELIYQALIEEAEQYGIDTTQIVQKFEAERNAIEEEFTEKRIERINRERSAYVDVFQNLGNAFISFGEIVARTERQKIQFKRIAAIAQIAIDTATAISSVVAAASASSPDPVVLAIKVTAGIAQVLASIAKAKAALSEAPSLPQRRHGRFFNVRGQDDGRTYNAEYLGSRSTGMLPGRPNLVLASEDGPEYFVSNKALNDPRVANYVGMIDAIVSNRVPQFRDGQATQQVEFSPSTSSEAVSVPIEKMNLLLEMLLTQGVRTELTDDAILRSNNRLKQLNEDSGGDIL